jgi:hypothetical protein
LHPFFSHFANASSKAVLVDLLNDCSHNHQQVFQDFFEQMLTFENRGHYCSWITAAAELLAVLNFIAGFVFSSFNICKEQILLAFNAIFVTHVSAR